ncbi:membrane protein DedA with SNARE-associated domain [Gemmobacter caeni]|jgi:membrane protein DedA with SNARE-associated domain|uniref:Membrane protein DedA with SNARE-associated domain n=1 Tax=Gemmobacter caeni TaxID=589035 RepID=A0A2T6B2T2_9RHOB|nr:DedA family protein [Gemmobacter caeni]PTX50388.1 membrane protein DedA with SNARE-associated domain [Gemmobacter caeni]TWI98395.1 membrane protein DedA with SNARE-associated domain [Gemmobacter caeni]
MMPQPDLVALIQHHGLLVLAPLALIEGPVVTVIAAYLARLGLMDLPAVVICVIVADVAGDALFYALGRHGRRLVRQRWLDRIGLTRPRLARLVRAFRAQGTRLLVVGKLTHSAGAAVLTAAGIARMDFGKFLMVNLLASIPKSLLFVGLGWIFGSAWQRIDDWIFHGALVLTAVVLLASGLWFLRKRRIGQ